MVLLCWWYRISTDNRGSVRPSIRSSFVVRRNQNSSKRYCDLIDMHAEHAKEILYPISLKVIGVHSIKVAPFLVAKGGRYLELCRKREGGGGTLKAFSFAVNGWPGSSFAHWTLWLGLLMPTWHTIFYYFSCKEHTAPAEFCYHHPKNPLLQLYPNAIYTKINCIWLVCHLHETETSCKLQDFWYCFVRRSWSPPLLCNTISWGILGSSQKAWS